MVFWAVLAFFRVAKEKCTFLEEFSLIQQNTLSGQESL